MHNNVIEFQFEWDTIGWAREGFREMYTASMRDNLEDITHNRYCYKIFFIIGFIIGYVRFCKINIFVYIYTYRNI